MKYKLFFAVLLVPAMISAKYIDTRDLTPELKQVQRLLGAKRDASGAAATQAAAATILAAGAGLAIVGGAYYRPYYYPYYRSYRRPYPYYGRRRYYSPATTVGGALMLAGAASSAAASAEVEAITQNNESIERKIIDIISGLVRSDEDYQKEAQVLNLRLSNSGEQLKARLDQTAKTQLEAIYAPSNQMESNLKMALQELPTRYNIQQYEQSLNKLSNQILGIEPAPRPVKEIKADAKNMVKALKMARKNYAKDVKTLNKQAVKDRKTFAKRLSQPINQVLIDRQKEYDAFIEKSTNEIDTLFKTYYQAYYVKLM
ncbi:MAG: hypothetical protein ACRCY4_06055 [Brevinema sp.]